MNQERLDFMNETNFQLTPQRVFYVNFCDEIDIKRSRCLMQVCSECVKDSDLIYLTMSSPGGNVDLAFTLFNFLRSLPCKLVTHNIGSIDSAAIYVFLAGGHRIASPNARFLLHGVCIPTPAQMYPFMLAEALDRSRQDEKRMKELLHARTGLEESQIDGFFRCGEFKGSQFALENGIVSEIGEFKLPMGARFFSCNFQ